MPSAGTSTSERRRTRLPNGKPPVIERAEPERGHSWAVWVPLTALVMILLAGVVAGSYVIGRDSRPSSQAIASRIAHQRTVDQVTRDSALVAQQHTLAREFTRRLRRAKRRAFSNGNAQGVQTGFASGQATGQATGFRQGHKAGKAQGLVRGYNQGSVDGYIQGLNSSTPVGVP